MKTYLRRDRARVNSAPPTEEPARFFPAPEPSNDELTRMPLGEALKWTADENGRMQRRRLFRVARARGYSPAWIARNIKRPWQDCLRDMSNWHHQKVRQVARAASKE